MCSEISRVEQYLIDNTADKAQKIRAMDLLIAFHLQPDQSVAAAKMAAKQVQLQGEVDQLKRERAELKDMHEHRLRNEAGVEHNRKIAKALAYELSCLDTESYDEKAGELILAELMVAQKRGEFLAELVNSPESNEQWAIGAEASPPQGGC